MTKSITCMRCAASFLALLLLATSCRNCVPPASQESQENTFKAKFTAVPNLFSDDGDYGKVYGVLRELSPSGELLHETPLGDSELMLHFEKYSSEIELCVYGSNEFLVRGGINAETFKIEAEAISDRGKGCKRTIFIMRDGWRFSFKAESSQLTPKGGTGKVIGMMYITNFDGNVVREGNLCDSNFGLNVSGNPKGTTVDFDAKTFMVVAGGLATSELQAYAGYGQPHLIEIKREG